MTCMSYHMSTIFVSLDAFESMLVVTVLITIRLYQQEPATEACVNARDHKALLRLKP